MVIVAEVDVLAKVAPDDLQHPLINGLAGQLRAVVEDDLPRAPGRAHRARVMPWRARGA